MIELNCRFVFGENHPPQMRAISCIGPGPGLIFLNDASDKSWETWVGMMETTAPKGSLAAVRSQGRRLRPPVPEATPGS